MMAMAFRLFGLTQFFTDWNQGGIFTGITIDFCKRSARIRAIALGGCAYAFVGTDVDMDFVLSV